MKVLHERKEQAARLQVRQRGLSLALQVHQTGVELQEARGRRVRRPACSSPPGGESAKETFWEGDLVKLLENETLPGAPEILFVLRSHCCFSTNLFRWGVFYDLFRAAWNHHVSRSQGLLVRAGPSGTPSSSRRPRQAGARSRASSRAPRKSTESKSIRHFLTLHRVPKTLLDTIWSV